jgi:PST family polysaccharide transporter
MIRPLRSPGSDSPPVRAGEAVADAATTHPTGQESLRDAHDSAGARNNRSDRNEERRSEVPDSEHDPSLEGLGSRLRSGAKFTSIALVATQIISLGQTIVLARILSPLEIGTFVLGTLFANFLMTLTDGGMRAALIHRGREVEDAANTVFWVSLVTGTAMSLAALAAAPLLALYFDDRLVGLVCAATCGTLLIHSLLNVPEALMQRKFNFKRRLIVDPTTASTFALVTVTLCLLGFGVWGLVIGLYASQLATLAACWALAGWRPGRGRFVFRIWREMAGYAAPLIISGVVVHVTEAVQQWLVGSRLDIASAGQYRYGRRIGVLPGQAILQIASYVLFPAFARIAIDMARFRDGLLRSLRVLWSATTPFAAVLVALGQPLVVVLLGEKWQTAGLFVAAMAGYGPGIALGAISIEAMKGAGASKLINWPTAVSVVVGIGGLIVLLPFGLVGVGIATSLDALLAGALALLLARRLAGVSLRDLGGVLIPPLVAAMVAGTVVGLLEHGLVHSDQRRLVLGLVLLAVEGVLLLGIFGGLLYLMAPDSVRELRDGLLHRRQGGRDGDDGDEAGHDEGAGPGSTPDD